MSAVIKPSANKLRERMQQLKDRIDLAEDREHDAKEVLKEVEEKAYQFESECGSKERKITLTKKALAAKKRELAKKDARLEEIGEKDERESELVKTLENMEFDGDEKLNDLEKELQKIQHIADIKESENKELTLRQAQLESEYDKVFRREGEALEKVERLRNNIQTATSEMDCLKDKEDGAYEKEDENDKKLTFLTKELHTMVTEAEEKERQVVNLELFKDRITAEIAEEKKKIEEVHNEMASMEDDMDDI